MFEYQNFFSSQLIRVDDSGQISVVSGSWWFAVVSVPLTILTFLVWKWWLSHSIMMQERNQVAEIVQKEGEKSKSQGLWPANKGRRWLDWKHVSGMKGRRQARLVDDGNEP
jgi:hypothetical protein